MTTEPAATAPPAIDWKDNDAVKKAVVAVLKKSPTPLRLQAVWDALKPPAEPYKVAYDAYCAISRVFQLLKHEKRAIYLTGKGGGWVVAGSKLARGRR